MIAEAERERGCERNEKDMRDFGEGGEKDREG